jgi:hypothetical protein
LKHSGRLAGFIEPCDTTASEPIRALVVAARACGADYLDLPLPAKRIDTKPS